MPQRALTETRTAIPRFIFVLSLRLLRPESLLKIVFFRGSSAPSRLFPNICHSRVTGRPNIVNRQPFHCASHTFLGHSRSHTATSGCRSPSDATDLDRVQFRGKREMKTAERNRSSRENRLLRST